MVLGVKAGLEKIITVSISARAALNPARLHRAPGGANPEASQAQPSPGEERRRALLSHALGEAKQAMAENFIIGAAPFRGLSAVMMANSRVRKARRVGAPG